MKRRFLLLALLFVVSWIMYLDRAAISTAKEAMASDMALSDEAMGLVFSAFALGYALAQIPAGWFSDRFGPKLVLTAVVGAWSLMTALTGAVHSLAALVMVRFVFGVAEAGAFPSAARVFYNWMPPEQHGRANGITFSGSRLGAAFAFPLLAWLTSDFGWRLSFSFLCIPGVLWAAVWFAWFRDRAPDYVPPKPPAGSSDVPLHRVFASPPMLLAMAQYFASNFTFFLCLTWMNPYLVEHYRLTRETAAWYSSLVFLFGATAHWVAGFLTDTLHRSRLRRHSRRLPAIAGFLIAAASVGALPSAGHAATAVFLFTAATFGAELTISPSWAFCIDLGGRKSGAVSGAMNMAGNFGSFASANVFPWLYHATGSASAYFAAACALNLLAVLIWTRMRSQAIPEAIWPDEKYKH